MKVLIIGLGSIAKKHIKALRRASVNEIFALRSSRGSENYEGVINLYSFSEIKEQNFDFFLISNITFKHAEAIKKLLPFKKPLFIEKPVFNEINEENNSLVAKINELQIPTYIGCSLRFLDCLQELKKHVTNKRINEVTIYSGSFLPDWRPHTNFRNTYSANKEMGGGVHIDLIHELDYLFWIFGEPERTRSHFSSKSSLKINSVDYANYLWEYRDFNASITLNYYRVESKRKIEVLTSDATFETDLLLNKVYKNGEEIYSSDQRIPDTLFDQMDFFLDQIQNKKINDFNSINEAYKILKLCLEN
ncbi:Gfo/Idh/MocA family protein [Salinimicrobium sp. HB62]|uniref:Gfo/Idh/MocA family protein n=1 Tax=Salinimicrobium sp. HB62 TaxID=3077781 RepID=UPI002D767B2A|nr:Gfo/Idh/MocA family oxidoreductase [Salinimicrobium sp. HB62]